MKTALRHLVLWTVALSAVNAFGADPWKGALSTIPADAMAFLCIPNVKQVDADYQQAIVNFGLQPFVSPPANSLLAMLKSRLPLAEQLDENGALVFVLLPAMTLPELQAKQAFVIPVKDPKAAIEAMQGQAAEGGLYTVQLLNMPAVAMTTEHHVIVAMSPEAAKAMKEKTAGIDSMLKPHELKSLEGLDFAVWLNAEKLIQMVKPMIDGMLVPMMMMQASQGGPAAAQAEMNKKNIDMLVNGMATLTVGLSLDNPGVGLRFAMTARAGSDLASQVKVKPTTESLLKGLPASEYLVAFGQTIHPEATASAMNTFDSGLQGLLTSAGLEIDPQRVTELRALLKDWAPMTTSARGTVDALPAGENGLLGVSLLMETTDAGKWIEHFGKMVGLVKQIASDVATKKGGDQAKEITPIIEAVTFDEKGEDVGGINVRQFKVDIDKIAKSQDGDEEDIEETKKIIGKEGVVIRVASADGKKVLIAFGGGKARMSSLIEAAKKGDAPLEMDAGIKKVSAVGPKERSSVMYVAGDRIVRFIQTVQRTLEADVLPIEVPQINAPLALTSTGGDGWGQFELFFPTDLVVAGKDAVMMMMASQGGPQGSAAHGPKKTKGGDGKESDKEDNEDEEDDDE